MVGQFAGSTYTERSIAAMSERIAKVMAMHDVPLSWGIMRVGRTLSTLDASLQTLWPDADFMKLARIYFRDRTRRANTPRGRLERMRQVFTDLSIIGSDAKLLLGSGLRHQALRLHGVMDRVTHVRVVVLSWLLRLAWLMLIVVGAFAALDESRGRTFSGVWSFVHYLHIDSLITAIPDLHPVHWVMLMALVLFLVRFIRATRRSIGGHD